jgi:hypothetical protein
VVIQGCSQGLSDKGGARFNERSRSKAHEVRARRSASALTGGSSIARIAIMPGDTNDQYRRNFARADASVATARVSVRNTDSVE